MTVRFGYVLIATVQYFVSLQLRRVCLHFARATMLTPWKIQIWTRFDIRISTMGLCIILCIKGKIHLYSALDDSSTQPCITDRAAVQPRPQPKPALTDFHLLP